MMAEDARLKKFIVDLDQILQDNEYYDDEKQIFVFDITEAQCYNALMQNEEYHLLTSDRVKSFISLFMGSHHDRMLILRQFNVL